MAPLIWSLCSLISLRNALRYMDDKILKHKGLKNYFESGTTRGIQAVHSKKLKLQLAALDTATSIEDMDIPEYQLHPLKGDRKEFWSISVNGNWRVTFEFTDGNAFIFDYEDYH